MQEKIKLIISATLILLFCNSMSAQADAFLPKPTGKYNVGTISYYLTDSTRKEKFTCKGKDKRTLKVKIWYPSENFIGPFDNYLEEYSVEEVFASYQSFSKDINYFKELKEFKTHSKKDIPVFNGDTKFPLILFSQGYYFGLDDFYTCYMEELASQGYIVVSLTHTYEQIITKISENESVKIKQMRVSKAFVQWQIAKLFKTKYPDPENRKKVRRTLRYYFRNISVLRKSMKIWVDDSQFVLDKILCMNEDPGSIFYNKIDTQNIASTGMSYGGAVAVQYGILDPRIKVCINLDGFQFGDVLGQSIRKPVLMMQSDLYYDQQVGNNEIFSDTYPYYYFQFFNSKHYIFSDCCIFPNMTKEKKKYLIGFESGDQHIKLTNQYMLAFLNYYLKGKENRILTEEINNSTYKFKIRK